jgi:hypothetical protein
MASIALSPKRPIKNRGAEFLPVPTVEDVSYLVSAYSCWSRRISSGDGYTGALRENGDTDPLYGRHSEAVIEAQISQAEGHSMAVGREHIAWTCHVKQLLG